jgi:hypothetical protein
MKFTFLFSGKLPLNPNTHWIWFSARSNAFVVGDEHLSFRLPPPGNVHQAEQLIPERVEGAPHGSNLPLPERLMDEFLSESWHGFRWLDRPAYASALDSSGVRVGDLLRTIVFGPDYGQYVQLPSNNAIIALQSGSLRLLQRSDHAFVELDHAKTRGRAVLAYAAHPGDPFIVYGDNSGDFFSHHVGTSEFGKTSRIAGHGRKASQVDFIDDGKTLVIGGMGYLATYSYENGKFSVVHEESSAVRSFCWLKHSRFMVVNKGIHGVSVLRLSESGFSQVADLPTEGAVHALAPSADGAHLGLIFQNSEIVSVYSL